MKKNIIILICILFIGCKTQYTNKMGGVITHGFDFLKYSEVGFLFTPHTYGGNHDVLGIFVFELHPTVTYKQPSKTNHNFDYNYYGIGYNIVKCVDVLRWDVLIDEVYLTSINMGGDGFMNFSYSVGIGNTEKKPDLSGIDNTLKEFLLLHHKTTSYQYLIVEGVIIKRK